MSCSICKHPQRRAIDQALMAGSATLAALGQQYQLSTSSLHRHKAHLQAKISRAKQKLQDNLTQGCLFWLGQALEMIMQTAQAAQAEGNHKVGLQALAQGTRLVTIILKHDLPLDDRLVYDTLTSPQWADQTGLFPHDPQILAAGRQALLGQFSSDCPETPPPASSSAPGGEGDLDLLRTFCASPLNPQIKIAHPKSQAEKRLFKSGKLAGKIPPASNNNQKNQEDILLQKIAEIDFASLPKSIVGTINSKLGSLFQQWDHEEKIPSDIPLSEYIYEKALKAGCQEKISTPPTSPGNGTGAAKAAS